MWWPMARSGLLKEKRNLGLWITSRVNRRSQSLTRGSTIKKSLSFSLISFSIIPDPKGVYLWIRKEKEKRKWTRTWALRAFLFLLPSSLTINIELGMKKKKKSSPGPLTREARSAQTLGQRNKKKRTAQSLFPQLTGVCAAAIEIMCLNSCARRTHSHRHTDQRTLRLMKWLAAVLCLGLCAGECERVNAQMAGLARLSPSAICRYALDSPVSWPAHFFE